MASCRNKSLPRENDDCLGSCSSKDPTPLLILNEGTIDHSCYMKNVLLVALKYGNEIFGDNWIFQQDGTNLHRHHLTKEWRSHNFLPFIDKDR